MALKRETYDIEVRYDDAIKHNRTFFDFMQRTFNCLDGLYMDGFFVLMDTIKKFQLRKHSAAEVERPNRGKKDRKKVRYTQAYQKKGCFVNKKTRTS